MILTMRTLTLEDPAFAGTYEVEQLASGDLLLRRSPTSFDAIQSRRGGRRLTPDEFERDFGDLPPRRGGIAVATSGPRFAASFDERPW